MRTDGTRTGPTGSADTPPQATADRRRTLIVRGGLVVAVGAAVAVGIASHVGAAVAPFSVDEPRPEQRVATGQDLRASGTPGDAPEGSLWVLARGPAEGGELYTLGERAVLADGRWSGRVRPPSAKPGAPVAVVIVRSDPECGGQLAAMAGDEQGDGRFYGPLPAGCTALATVPVQVAGR